MKTTMMICAAALMNAAAMGAKQPDVKGTIVDANGKPFDCANVVLMSLPDSTFVQGATSGLDGNFCITTNVDKGVLKVSSIGFETIYINMSEFTGMIVMKEDAQMLSEITVSSMLPKTKLTGNSMVTTVKGTVLEKSGTAKDMLSKVPGMTKKGDDLEVLGKGTPVVYINGRKMTDPDELKRLRSEEIKEVEVITNPGAQYDATVSSVVRIKTIKRKGNGFGYDLSLVSDNDLLYGNYDPSATLNLRYRHNNVDVFGMVNYWQWSTVNEATPNQWSYFKQKGELMNITQMMKLDSEWKGDGLNANIGFNWQIAENHSVGMRIERNDMFDPHTDLWQTTEMTKTRMSDNSLVEKALSNNSQRATSSIPFNWSGNAYYNGKVGNLGIDLNVDFLTRKNTDRTSIKDVTDGVTSNLSSVNPGSSHMIATKLVLSYPVWKGMLNFGSENSFVTRNSSYQIDGVNIPSTKSEVQENNIAFFAEYGMMLPKIGSLSAGLRYEHVGFDYTDLIDGKGSMSRYTDDFFPTFSWANRFGMVQASLNYSIKTERPNYQVLDESMVYINPYSYQQGDPKLKNTTIQQVGASINYKWINLYLSYSKTDDALSQWSYIYNDEGVILLKNINLENPVHMRGAFISLFPTWGCYSLNGTVGIQAIKYSQTLADPREASGSRKISYDDPLFVLNLSHTVRLKKSWQLECNMNYLSKGDVMNARIDNTTCNLGFVVQKSWLANDALCLRASISDVLNHAGQRIKLDCGYYEIEQFTRRNSQRLNISLRYTFNATPNKYKGTGAGKDAASRLGN